VKQVNVLAKLPLPDLSVARELQRRNEQLESGLLGTTTLDPMIKHFLEQQRSLEIAALGSRELIQEATRAFATAVTFTRL